MTAPLAPEAPAKDVTKRLRAVAIELKEAEPLHLPDFLDIDPRAPYEAWNARFEEKRKRIICAPEGTADAQVDLCRTLAAEFKEQRSWRGLLNRLGWMQVEAPIAAMSRRPPPPDLLRNALETHVHTLEFVVGAPDGRRVVECLFEDRGLVVPRGPEPAMDRPPVVVREPEPEAPPAGGGGGFLGRLGGVLLEALGEHLDRKVDRVGERIEEQRQAAADAPAVAGTWYSPAGGTFTFSQRGRRVDLQGSAAGVPVGGRGTVSGRSIELKGFSPNGGPFRASFVVSADGSSMTGQVIDGYGRASPVELSR